MNMVLIVLGVVLVAILSIVVPTLLSGASPLPTSRAVRETMLSVLPDTPVGSRDRAIILVLTLTGRRRTEVLSLKARDLSRDGDAIFYSYRGKGGKTGKRELPQPAYQAIQVALVAFGKDPWPMGPDEPLWPSRADSGRGISSGTFYGALRRYLKAAGLPPSGVHVFRHSAAKLRREAG